MVNERDRNGCTIKEKRKEGRTRDGHLPPQRKKWRKTDGRREGERETALENNRREKDWR